MHWQLYRSTTPRQGTRARLFNTCTTDSTAKKSISAIKQFLAVLNARRQPADNIPDDILLSTGSLDDLKGWMLKLAEVKTPEEVEVVISRNQSKRMVTDHVSNPAMVSGEQYEKAIESATQGNACPERKRMEGVMAVRKLAVERKRLWWKVMVIMTVRELGVKRTSREDAG